MSQLFDLGEIDLPDGEYTGLWGGYVIEITEEPYIGNKIVTPIGIRSFNIPVVVTVTYHKATAEIIGERSDA